MSQSITPLNNDWDCITSFPFFACSWVVRLQSQSSAPCPVWVPPEVKHVSGAWDEAREREMSQMNTCQVMSSPVSTDDQPQLFWCTEACFVAPVGGRFSSQNRTHCSRVFYDSLAMKPTEVNWRRHYISNRAWFHSASLAEHLIWRVSVVFRVNLVQK